MANSQDNEYCSVCSSQMAKMLNCVAISGTRDTFGIGKEFVDERTGKEVDTWKKWEKAGYRDAKEFHANSHPKIKEGIKQKIKRVRNKGTEKMQTTLA